MTNVGLHEELEIRRLLLIYTRNGKHCFGNKLILRENNYAIAAILYPKLARPLLSLSFLLASNSPDRCSSKSNLRYGLEACRYLTDVGISVLSSQLLF